MSSQGKLSNTLDNKGEFPQCYDEFGNYRPYWCLNCRIRSAEEGCQKLEDGASCSAMNENHTEWCLNCIDGCPNLSYVGLSDQFCKNDCKHDPNKCLTAKVFSSCPCPTCKQRGKVRDDAISVAKKLLDIKQYHVFLAALDPPHKRTSVAYLFFDIEKHIMPVLTPKSITCELKTKIWNLVWGMLDLQSMELRRKLDLQSMELRRKRDAEAANADNPDSLLCTNPGFDSCGHYLDDVPDDLLDLLVKIACQKNIALPDDCLWHRYIQQYDIFCKELVDLMNAFGVDQTSINPCNNDTEINTSNVSLNTNQEEIEALKKEIHWRRNCIEKQNSLRKAEASHNLEAFACLPFFDEEED